MLSIGYLGSKHLPDELHSHAHTQRYITSDEPEQLFMGCVQMQFELLKKKKEREKREGLLNVVNLSVKNVLLYLHDLLHTYPGTTTPFNSLSHAVCKAVFVTFITKVYDSGSDDEHQTNTRNKCVQMYSSQIAYNTVVLSVGKQEYKAGSC